MYEGTLYYLIRTSCSATDYIEMKVKQQVNKVIWNIDRVIALCGQIMTFVWHFYDGILHRLLSLYSISEMTNE